MSTVASRGKNSTAAILSRVFEAIDEDFPEEAARSYLRLSFPKADIRRMNYLSAKAREGRLTDKERQEAEHYDLVGHVLALLKARAQRVLKQTGREKA